MIAGLPCRSCGVRHPAKCHGEGAVAVQPWQQLLLLHPFACHMGLHDKDDIIDKMASKNASAFMLSCVAACWADCWSWVLIPCKRYVLQCLLRACAAALQIHCLDCRPMWPLGCCEQL